MIPIIDTLKPMGDFPAVNARDVAVGDEKTLVQALSEKAGNADVAALQSGKVDKVSGKGLSTNDYSDAEKTKVANAASNISELQSSKVDKVTGKGLSTNDYTDSDKTKLSNAVDSINSLQSNKVDKVSGKGLSANDYSDVEKQKLANAEQEIAKFNSYFRLV